MATLGDDERVAVDEVVEMLRGNLEKIAEHGKRADGIVKSMLETRRLGAELRHLLARLPGRCRRHHFPVPEYLATVISRS
jgi:hypothetical protein